MAFEHALRASAALLAATGFASLLWAHTVPLWLAGVTFAVLIYTVLQLVGWPTAGGGVRLRATPMLWNAVLIGAFALFLLDVMTISRELLPAGIHFLVVLLNVKLMTMQDRRDYRHVYAISLMAVLASAALTTDLWYVVVFAAYLLAAVWSLLLYHLSERSMLAPRAGDGARAASGAAPSVTSTFFWLTNGIALVTFVFTLIIFFLLPRISVGILQKPRGEGLRTTGFSERVDLGMIGSVKEDPQIVMRVELPDPPVTVRERLYLRGLAFDQYNGRTWSSGSRQRRNLALGPDGMFAVRQGGGARVSDAAELLRQDILLEPLDTAVLFAAPFADSVGGDFPGVQLDSMTGLHLPYPSPARTRYSVVSREHRILPPEQASAALQYPAAIRDRYLQLPQGSDRIADLARHVTERAVGPVDRAAAVLNHLLSSYTYSLEVGAGSNSPPIDDFLFTRKTGYCEHYATAMVLMLRSIGIPSRLVTGFLATEWNDFGNYYTVRQRDAHAWVEVYYPLSGWVTMDPTPANATIPTPSLWVAVQRLGESMRLHWDRVFIRYSGRDQLAIINSLRDGSDSARDVLGQWMSGVCRAFLGLMHELRERVSTGSGSIIWTATVLATFALISLLLMSSGRWLHRRLSLERPSTRKQQQIVQLYKHARELSARRGLKITPATTSTELALLVSQRWNAAEAAVGRLTALYSRSRFSAHPLSVEELTAAAEDIGMLKELVKQSD